MNKKVLIIAALSSIAILGGAYYFLSARAKKNKENQDDVITDSDTSHNTSETIRPKPSVVDNSKNENIKSLKKNLGSAYVDKGDSVLMPSFNNGKHMAVFYDNNRFAIFNKGTTASPILKGSYKNGGLTLIPDGGSEIKSDSVIKNLVNLKLKK